MLSVLISVIAVLETTIEDVFSSSHSFSVPHSPIPASKSAFTDAKMLCHDKSERFVTPPSEKTVDSTEPPSIPSSLCLMHEKFLLSTRNIINLKTATWKKVDRLFSLCGKKPIPFICLALGELEKNFLVDQGTFNQYTIAIKVDLPTEKALTTLIDSCPEKGVTSPLNGSTLRCGVKYDKVFDEASKKGHNGALVPYPYISDARDITGGIPRDLCELPNFEAIALTPGSIVAVGFTMTSFTYREGGISAKLEHVYLVKLGKDKEVLRTPLKKRVITLSDEESSDSE